MSKILLVEDDEKLAKLVLDFLPKDLYQIEWVANGRDAQDRLAISVFDLLILDWDLPFVDGVTVLKEYRSKGGLAKVLMLTGKEQIAEKEVGFDSGADDYLTKPFHFKELAMRLRALLRRPAEIVSDVLKLRGIELDVDEHKVLKNGVVVELLPKEFALLEFFMKHPNHIYNLEALQTHIWPSDSESSPETIRVHVARIRSKIENEDDPPIIKTVHRRGYMFDALGDGEK